MDVFETIKQTVWTGSSIPARTNDPILNLASQWGFDVTLYEPKSAPWEQFFTLFVHNQIFIGSLGTLLFQARLFPDGSFARNLAGILGLFAIVGWPYFYGQSGLGIIDFGMPAYGFLGTLHIVDIFFLRDWHEVKDWSFARFYCQIFAFVNEESTTQHPRWENVKAMGVCLLKMVGVNILMYASPPPQYMENVHGWFAFFGYNVTVGGAILCTLGFLIEGILRLNGIVWGIEMSPLFANPLGAPNVREFWARWNLVIKDGLHRVIFGFQQGRKARAERAKKSKGNGAANGSAKPKSKKPDRFHHKDHLSETEASSSEASADEAAIAAKEKKAKEIGAKPAPKKQDSKEKKKKGGFVQKAVLASLTFAASGAFHEYMNHLAFNGATGENMMYFLCHAAGTVTYVWLCRNMPQVVDHIPWPVGVVLVNLFAFLTSPFFCMPFIRAGFFEDLKSFGIFGPIKGMVWFWGH